MNPVTALYVATLLSALVGLTGGWIIRGIYEKDKRPRRW